MQYNITWYFNKSNNMLKAIIPVLLLIIVGFSGCQAKDHEVTVPITSKPRATKGTVDTQQIINSTIMKMEVHYSIYLPPGYEESSSTTYPVLYLLHGYDGDYLDWINKGNMVDIVDKTNSIGNIKEMIIVMPSGMNSYYLNDYFGGSLRYEDFFINEFIPQVESKYRVTSNDRAIAGLSMGGFGTTYLAFKYSELFTSAYSMSGVFNIGNPPLIKTIINSKTNKELIELPPFTMEYGTEDVITRSQNIDFDAFLTGKGINHTYIKRSGTHEWSFWQLSLPKALNFASKYFK